MTRDARNREIVAELNALKHECPCTWCAKRDTLECCHGNPVAPGIALLKRLTTPPPEEPPKECH